MASFFSDLWTSVFTPGPTPTLLAATNATFAALQALLFILLVATYSVHFAVLSLLSAGLWWSINWFARELAAAKEIELDEKERGGREKSRSPEGEGGSDTETEAPAKPRPPPVTKLPPGAAKGEPGAQKATGNTLKPENAEGSVKKRKSMGESGYISTDSEWEKVDESG